MVPYLTKKADPSGFFNWLRRHAESLHGVGSPGPIANPTRKGPGRAYGFSGQPAGSKLARKAARGDLGVRPMTPVARAYQNIEIGKR